MIKKQVSIIAFVVCVICISAEYSEAQLFRRGVIRQSAPVYQTYQQPTFYSPTSFSTSNHSSITRPFYYSSPQGVARRIPGQTVPVQTFVANFAPARTQSAARRTYSSSPRYYGW